MTDPFMMKDAPWYVWPKVIALLVFLGITILLVRWPSFGPLERRVTWVVFFGGLAGVAMIWFPNVFENYDALARESLIDKVKPQRNEVSIGWLLLLGPFVAWLVMKLV